MENTKLEKIKHFPAVVKNFIFFALNGLFKIRGSTLLLIFILFICFTGSYKIMYYKILIDIDTYKVESIKNDIETQKKLLIKFENNIICYKNQSIRIINNKDININYCNY